MVNSLKNYIPTFYKENNYQIIGDTIWLRGNQLFYVKFFQVRNNL